MSKFRILCLAAAFALSASAASPMKKVSMSGVEGWGAGFYTGGVQSNGGFQLDYKNVDREFGFFGNARFVGNGGGTSYNQFGMGFFGGARQMIRDKLALSGGFIGSMQVVDQWSNRNIQTVPYNVGFYAQMSYEPTNFISLWTRSQVWGYTENGTAATGTVTSLAQGTSAGISYYYGAK